MTLQKQIDALRAQRIPPGHPRRKAAKRRALDRLEARQRSRYKPDPKWEAPF